MDKSEYLELDQFFLPKTPIPIYSEQNARIHARSVNPPIYHPSYPSREEVRKSNYIRRQQQIQGQGFYTPNTKPYSEIGGPLILDARQLTIISLSQPAGKDGEYGAYSPHGLDASYRENDAQQKRRGSVKSGKDDVASLAGSEESNEQRLRLYRLKHQGEVMDVKKEAKAMQWMSRFASNGQPLFSLLNRVEDFRNMAKYGAHAQVSNRTTKKQEDDKCSVVNPSSAAPTETSSSPRSSSNFQDGDSSSDDDDSTESSNINKVASKTDQARPYSANHYRIGAPTPNQAACEHLYRQLCALCWLLDAIENTDPNVTVCPIIQSWNLQGLSNMKVNIQESQQKTTAIDNNWSSFVSHHHGNAGTTGAPGTKRSNLKQGGSKYGGSSNAESRRLHGAGLALSLVTSELNESVDIALAESINGGATDRFPPTEASTTVVLQPNESQHQQSSGPNQNGDPGSVVDGTATSSSQLQTNTLAVQLPNSPTTTNELRMDGGSFTTRDDVRSKTPNSGRYRAGQARNGRQTGSAVSRSSSSAQSERKSDSTISYRKLMRNRELLTAKLHEVEVSIDREERFRSFRRSHRHSASAGGTASQNVAGADFSRDLLEFTTRAASARYSTLANRSQHRFKTTAEEQALIVSDTLHQMDSRRMELFKMKLETLESSSGCSSAASSSKAPPPTINAAGKSSTSAPTSAPVSARSQQAIRMSETFDRATRRLRAKTAAAERRRRMAVEQANEERQRDWLGALRSFLPPPMLNDWRSRKIMERLERHVGMRPNQTTDLNRFLDTLKTLRAFEICDPDVAAAVEFCRERVLRFPINEFEDFFRKHFPAVVRPEKVVQKKKKHHHNTHIQV